MFKRKRKSDAKISTEETANGTGRSDSLEMKSNVLQDTGWQKSKKEKSVISDRDPIKLKPIMKTKKIGTPGKSSDKFDKRTKNKENHAQTDVKPESLDLEEIEIKSPATDSYLRTSSDQEETKNYQIVAALKNTEDKRKETEPWSRSGNQSLETKNVSTCHSIDDCMILIDEGVQGKNLDSVLDSPDVCCGVSKAGELEQKNYQSFLRNIDKATGSTVIQSEDSYEKLRYSTPRIKRFKEATAGSLDSENVKRSLFHGPKGSESRKSRRDKETRNSNDIIISGNFENGRYMECRNSGMQKKRNNDSLQTFEPSARRSSSRIKDGKKTAEKYYSNRLIRKSNDERESNSAEKSSNAKKTLIHRDAEVQTKTASISATKIPTYYNLEEIGSPEKSLFRFFSDSRFRMTSEKDDDQTFVDGTIQSSKNQTLVTKTDCRDISDSRSRMNNFSVTKREHSFPEARIKNDSWPHSYGWRKPCRCGNGCGTIDKSTCCCKRI